MNILHTNTRSYVGVGHIRHSVTAVLVAGEIGDYAVYIGMGGRDHAGWIADHGDKLCFEEAQVHFPGIKREKYRL